jgi:hypothetical protein
MLPPIRLNQAHFEMLDGTPYFETRLARLLFQLLGFTIEHLATIAVLFNQLPRLLCRNSMLSGRSIRLRIPARPQRARDPGSDRASFCRLPSCPPFLRAF